MGAALRPIGSTVLGYPSSGRYQEYHQRLAQFAEGTCGVADLRATGHAVRLDGIRAMMAAGLDSVPINTFSFLDPMLDTALMLGALPPRFDSGNSTRIDIIEYLAATRGSGDSRPLERRPWYETNHWYSVPEIDSDTRFSLDPTTLLLELAEARTYAPNRIFRPVVIGPITFLALARSTSGRTFDPLSRLKQVLGEYRKLLAVLAEANVPWVQFDEPIASQNAFTTSIAAAYRELGAASARPAIVVAAPSSPPSAIRQLATTTVEGLVVDVANANHPETSYRDKNLVLGAIDGRGVRRTDLRLALTTLTSWRGRARSISVSSNCSLRHLPYDVSVETQLEPALRNNLAFADQKLSEVVALQQALDSEGDDADEAFAASDAALQKRASVSQWALEDVELRLHGAGYF